MHSLRWEHYGKLTWLFHVGSHHCDLSIGHLSLSDDGSSPVISSQEAWVQKSAIWWETLWPFVRCHQQLQSTFEVWVNTCFNSGDMVWWSECKMCWNNWCPAWVAGWKVVAMVDPVWRKWVTGGRPYLSVTVQPYLSVLWHSGGHSSASCLPLLPSWVPTAMGMYSFLMGIWSLQEK